jgi:hypothetical protein
MSTNIKLNPFYLSGIWTTDGLDYVIANDPANSNIEDYATVINEYMISIMYNAAYVSVADQTNIARAIAGVVNYLSEDSWCKDCCDNTFKSYKQLKEKIESLGTFSPLQLQYINQIIGMPCNYSITPIGEFKSMLSQLETTVLVDNQLQEYEKQPILLLISISKHTLDYWINQAGSGSWNTYMTPPPATDYIRPFWLMSILGGIVGCTMFKIGSPEYDLSLSLGGVCGAITG